MRKPDGERLLRRHFLDDRNGFLNVGGAGVVADGTRLTNSTLTGSARRTI